MLSINRTGFFWLYILIFVLAACQDSNPDKEYDLIITGGTIVDGKGVPPFEGDLAILGDRIVALSSSPLNVKLAKEVLQAEGLIVSPGFIDLHTNITVDLHEQPLAENFIRQGTTTVLSSLHSGDQAYPLDAYASILEIAPNVGYFAGHSWTRRQVMGLENRHATKEELDSMKYFVEQSMKQGALGLSTGLEYVPANYASQEEIIELAKVAAKYNGVYFTHMRNEGRGVLDAIRESIRIGEMADIPVQINHLKAAGRTQWGRSEQMLSVIDSARQVGVEITQDIYPYTAFSTYGSILIPQWALAGGVEALKKRLDDPSAAQKIRAEMRDLFMMDGGGEDLSLIQFRNFKYDTTFSGKTLKDYALAKGLEPTLETGIDLILELEMRGGFIGIFEAMDEKDITRFIQHPNTMFDSDADLTVFGTGHPHPRCYGAFPEVLGKYVREKQILSLETAIQKMTSMPADKIRQPDRGRIQEEAFADLVIFDFNTIRDNSTYTDPHHYPSGIEYVIVNGEIVFKEGKMTGKKPGQWLRGQR